MSTRKRSKRPAAPPQESSVGELQTPAESEASEPVANVSDIAELGEAQVEAEADEPSDDGVAVAEDDELMPEAPVEAPKTREQLKRVIESLVFVSDEVITAVQLGRLLKTKSAEIKPLLAELVQEWEGRGVELVEVANGYQFRSAPSSAPFVRDLVAQKPVRLTRAQLETLALVAYRQPITRPEIDDVRGVDSGSALKVLLERGLLKILGRKDEPGRPLLYGTAPYFLEFFGMKGMQDLPTLREFTELNEENRELFKRKTNEIGDLSNEPSTVTHSADPEEASINDEELAAIAEKAKHAGEDGYSDPPPPVSEASEGDADAEAGRVSARDAENDPEHRSENVGARSFELDDED